MGTESITTGGEAEHILVKDVLYIHSKYKGADAAVILWIKWIIAAALTAHTARYLLREFWRIPSAGEAEYCDLVYVRVIL